MPRFLFLMILLLNFYFPLASHGMGREPMGLSDWIKSSCQNHGRQFFSTIFSLEQSRVRNARFLRNRTEVFHPEFPPHSQCLSDNTGFPKDPLSSFLQHLFPSPDGTCLIANQSSDCVGKLDPHKIGDLLRLIEDHLLDPREEKIFRETLYAFFSRDKTQPHKYEKLVQDLPQFCKDDFIVKTLERLKLILSSAKDEYWEEHDLSPQDPFVLIKILKLSSSDSLPKDVDFKAFGLFNEEELQKYITALDPETPETLLKNRLRFFKNKEKEFGILRFIEILVSTLNSQRLKDPNLPRHLVENAVFQFFLKKAKGPEDFMAFLASYLRVDSTLISSTFPKKIFSEEDYWVIRRDLDLLRSSLRNPETAYLLNRGYDDFENPIPPLLPYQQASYRERTLPDCIETVFRNLFNAASRKSRADADLHKPREPASDAAPSERNVFVPFFSSPEHPLNKYYHWLNNDPQGPLSKEARDKWADLCSNLPHIRYLKSTQGKGERKDYEIAPGIINFLNFSRLLKDPSTAPLPFENNLEVLRQGFNELCFLLSPNKTFSWKEEDLTYYPAKGEYYGTVGFFIDGQPVFTLEMEEGEPGHGYLRNSPKAEGDWRELINIDDLTETLPVETLALFLTTPQAFKKAFTRLSPRDQIMLAEFLNLEHLHMQLAVIEASFQNPELKPFSKNLIALIHKLYDTSANKKFLEILIPNLDKLSDEEITGIFTACPNLLDGSIEDPSDPKTKPGESNNHFVLFALKQGKINWIKKALTLVESLTFNTVLDQSVFSDFIETYLLSCQDLRFFHIHNPYFKEEDVIKILRNLPPKVELSADLYNISCRYLEILLDSPPFSPSVKFFISFDHSTYNWEEKAGYGVVPVPNQEVWRNIFDLFHKLFQKNPTIAVEVQCRVSFSEDSKNQIREMFNISQFPEGKLSLVF